LFTVANQWTVGRMAYGFAPMSLVFLGFVPLVTRLKLFKLEVWWARAWLWFLGGVLVVLLDVLLVRWFAVYGGVALGVALALAGWLYFPMRQWLWQSLSRSALPQTSDILPDIVALSTPSAGRLPNAAWQQLWENHWHPLSVRDLAIAEQLEICDQGQSLRIPSLGQLPALELGMPLRGARLYNPSDLKRAQEVCTLVRIGLDAANAAQQGALEERQRIASDLHDDLGAKLLTIAQTAEQPQHGSRVAELARQALEDMRLALRGLSAGPIRVGDLQADWRAELMARLDVALPPRRYNSLACCAKLYLT
jgi:signal transduction histidine kinase